MSFTVCLALLYFLLAVLAGFAIVRGKKPVGIGILAAMACSIAILGFLWIMFPM